jgi:K+-sensing histidine kinase KdpD
MFAPFERLSATHGTACVGLGLTLARGLTEAMRGMPGT